MLAMPFHRWWYRWIILKKFPGWIAAARGKRARPHFVQDHERCLWTEEASSALQDIGVKLLKKYPKCSQDLNPIETAWRELRERIAETEPAQIETREAFVVRLRNCVKWLNKNRRAYFLHLCRSQKQRAKDVLKLKGARTKH